MSRGDSIPYGGGRLSYATAVGAATPVARRPATAAPVARTGRRRLANDPINWWLLALTVGYLAWSY